ncbi:molecular chaperone HtpG [Fluviibacter phosphoraccumulans]|uniref:Chaperone protein HtpG n=1 Tax=Fluviibacter phosphoraccumulans TaxID=1751046 RepID=A0A7R6QYC7_9RHOO|nr:molecular chaperone HtpG [Fluviibacter phosphoraccumulans]BBU69692.1 chaperone protein HtpG [Fluviibacter phosphoraccumulans]BBU71125.1 chaperone protein HtpG [Fluviibacter phosphoraccumulans]
MTNQTQTETKAFQAEVKQLLQLMIHSLYSNKEIFLRELVSNASDACDKLRYEALANPSLFENDPELGLRILLDAEAKTITIADNGIGMTKEEAIAHLGTIAKSGTKEFFSALTGDAQKDANLIGQFGVGFYSSFIVADKVTVRSRKAGAPANEGVEWVSAGEGEYTVADIDHPGRGTEVTLHLRAEQEDLLNGWKLREILRKYSDHIALPIRMAQEKWDEDAKAMKPTGEEETVNQASALWARPKSDVTEEEYKAFYQHVAHDYQEPLTWVHAKVEGRQEYTQLLYVPSQAPFDLWDRNARHGIKLYVKRVFIMDDAEQLMPTYMRFVRGVVDVADLPLNVSREILQESKDIEQIRSGCTKRVLGLLEELAENNVEKYTTFWNQFGQLLKEGVGEDQANQARIAKLLRFATTNTDSPEQNVSLTEYVSRMKPGQDKIYYVTAETFQGAKNSPHLEIFRKKGIEVLLLSDRVDEWVVSHLRDFDGKSLQSVAKGGLDLGELEDASEKQARAEAESSAKDLVERLQKALGEKLKEVRVTHRLTDSPACLVADEHDPGANLQRMLKMMGQNAPEIKPILEINPQHPMLKKMELLPNEGGHFDDYASVLFDEALLAEGGQIEDPAGFVRKINRLMLG